MRELIRRLGLWRLRDWLLWVTQGCPRDVPIVLRRGRLQACPHGKGLITGWWWSTRYMTTGCIYVEDLWERYSARYPVERVPKLRHCTFCRVVD